MEPSPTTCNYVYEINCPISIVSTSSIIKKSAVNAKEAILTLGRNYQREILLQIQIVSGRNGAHPAVASYPLKSCIVHQKLIGEGKGSIAIPSKDMVIMFKNCAPRKLNVFLKSLQAKLDLAKSNDVMKTPVNARQALLNGLPKVFNVLSPLTVGEIRNIRRIRGIATGDSPLAHGAKVSGTPKRILGSRNVQTTTPTRAKRPAVQEEATFERLTLTEEQKSVVRAVVRDKMNVFFTGSAGTGKSLILRRIIELLPASSTFVTAATGVAACQLGGITLHSFAGIGVGAAAPENSLKMALANPATTKQWKNCTHLIIDEISMIDATYFKTLEYVARNIKGISRPFGGIQLIITGDFLQLPPVTSGNQEPSFCFETEIWRKSIHKTIMLMSVKRQDDEKFVNLLQQIRIGRCDPLMTKVLKNTRDVDFESRGIVPTKLCTHTADADIINLKSLSDLKTLEKEFKAEENFRIPDKLKVIVPKLLKLKVEAQVMLTKNLDLARGLSNGSRGVVTKFSKNGLPVIKFYSTKEEIEIRPMTFSVRIPGVEENVWRKQLPLQLAWAISIHKSQGLTLDAVEMSLSRAFAEGQAYVALSRARSLDSVKIIGFDPCVIKANKKVVKYYDSIVENVNDDDDDFLIRKRSRLSL
ncbi:unnamed protein product [Auanema sp. JU1783]|nr:unnamed protein product [Auanema sp. JU1783]